MRKYLAVVRTQLKVELVYRFSIVTGLLLTGAKILFAWVLWSAVFRGRAEVAGFGFATMLSYYVVSTFLSRLEMADGISGEISTRIRDGSFSKYMVIPVDVQLHFVAQTAGAVAFYFLFNLASTALWSLLFGLRLVLAGDPIAILQAAALCLLGLVFMAQLNFALGILTFRLENIWLFLMIKSNLLVFVTGALVPLSLLPEGVVAAMRWLPFYYVTYLPSMLLVGRLSAEGWTGLAVIAAWVLAFGLLNPALYRRLRVRYDAVGI